MRTDSLDHSVGREYRRTYLVENNDFVLLHSLKIYLSFIVYFVYHNYKNSKIREKGTFGVVEIRTGMPSRTSYLTLTCTVYMVKVYLRNLH